MAEHAATRLSDLAENQPTEVDLDGTPVLLIRRGDTVHALAAKCPHRGVPLSKGVVSGDRIVCAAHRASFAIDSGEVLAPPACENLARYDVRIDGDDVFVTVPSDSVAHPLPAMARGGDDSRRFVIIGAGAAGWRAAETLRREGFGGDIVVLSDEPHGPLDRVELSKGYLAGDGTPDVPLVRRDADRAELDIELRHASVAEVDTDTREVVLRHSSERIDYDRLLIATGSAPRRLDPDRAHLKGVHTLRTVADADRIRDDLAHWPGKRPCRVAIIGGGFIGLEVAAGLSGRDGVEVTVIMNGDVPLKAVFGAEAGQRIMQEHRDAGVRFVTSAKVDNIAGDSRVSRVCLGSGDHVETDLVLIAIGAKPRTEFLPFKRADDGSIEVNADLSVPGFDDVFLAGDIARVPTPWGKMRIEHWRFAQETGELAARNMLGRNQSYDSTPFFWTRQQAPGSYTYTGHAGTWDRISGTPEGKTFRVDYIADGLTHAILALGFDDDVTLAERKMAGKGPI
ncbi:FAD-dependent oxidoreductase [Oceaniglobus indicus]|uniref:FAD-dependent oxidoreductase n=1 Tax=Oceaniglobus indicus TaxID=2047749 RepID=UPI0013043705|nr:FAD-dependent oxidoreductase [Oceaniglobus indicus]